jgi:hypothetical protein
VIRTTLCVAAGVLTAGSVMPYLRDIRRGRTRPQRTSWFVFSTLALVAAVSQFVGDPGPGAWLAAGAAGAFSLVFVASLRHGVGGFDARDLAALAVASVGGVVSIVTACPLVAVAAVVVAEMGAVVLTACKAALDPESETLSTWVLDGVAGVLAVVAVEGHSWMTMLYPVHHAVANATVAGAITAGRRRRSRSVPRASLAPAG